MIYFLICIVEQRLCDWSKPFYDFQLHGSHWIRITISRNVPNLQAFSRQLLSFLFCFFLCELVRMYACVCVCNVCITVKLELWVKQAFLKTKKFQKENMPVSFVYKIWTVIKCYSLKLYLFCPCWRTFSVSGLFPKHNT